MNLPTPRPTTFPLSVLIPARNEEANIAAAIQSVGWADEIWVVDSQSADRTADIARELRANVVQFTYPGGGPKKKNWALENLPFRNEWVLILDADERVTDDLEQEIRQALSHNGADGYFLDRDYIFMGRSLRCFRPNWNLRLFKHRLGRYERLATEVANTGDNEVHEHVLLPGRVAHLSSPLRHEDRRPLRAWVDNHNRYSEWEARVYQQFLQEPIPLARVLALEPVWRRRLLKRLWVRLPLRPLARFLAFYVFRKGFLDGRQGFRYAVLMAYYEFLITLKLKELSAADSRPVARSVDAARTQQAPEIAESGSSPLPADHH
jgi:glycosyltransferase involved in cell wall biosynthesis